jgi:hypothetical protein
VAPPVVRHRARGEKWSIHVSFCSSSCGEDGRGGVAFVAGYGDFWLPHRGGPWPGQRREREGVLPCAVVFSFRRGYMWDFTSFCAPRRRRGSSLFLAGYTSTGVERCSISLISHSYPRQPFSHAHSCPLSSLFLLLPFSKP